MLPLKKAPSGNHHAIAQQGRPLSIVLLVLDTQMGQANVFLMLTQLGVCQQIEGEDSKLSGQELCSGEAHTAWCQSQVRCQARSKMNVSSQDISLR